MRTVEQLEVETSDLTKRVHRAEEWALKLKHLRERMASIHWLANVPTSSNPASPLERLAAIAIIAGPLDV